MQCECSISDAADHGLWEEFHQKNGNHYMFAYHKGRRLELEREYELARERESTGVRNS